MKHLKSIFACAALVFAAFCQAATSYTGPVSGSSFTVLNSTTGVSIPFAIALVNSSGAVVPSSTYTLSINGSGDSAFSGLPSGFSGSVQVQSASSSDTTASTDFQVTYSGQHVYVCFSCNASAFAQRTDPNTGKQWFQNTAPRFSINEVSGTSPASTVTFYLNAGQLCAAVSVPSTAVSVTQTVGTNAAITYNTSTVPSGATPLGYVTLAASTATITGVTDLRPW